MFSFPLLKVGEIIGCLHELEIPATEDELLHCEKNKDAVRRIIEQLMEMCIGVSREDIASLKVSSMGCDSISYPELHEESVTELAMYRSVGEMMRRAGVADFTINDWFAPTAQRLRRNLSAVLNFAKFREEQLGLYKQLCDERDEKLRQVEASRQLCEEREVEVQKVEAQTLVEREEVEAVEAECEVMRGELRLRGEQQLERETRQLALGAVMEETELARPRVLEDIAAEGLKHANLRRTDEPTGFKTRGELEASIAELEEAMTSEGAALARAESEAQQLESATAQTPWSEVEAAVEALGSIESELAKHKTSLKQLKAQQEHLSEGEFELDDLRRRASSAKDRADSVEARLEHLRSHSSKANENTTTDLGQLRSDLQSNLTLAAQRKARHSALVDAEAQLRADHTRQIQAELKQDAWLDDALQGLQEHLSRLKVPAPYSGPQQPVLQEALQEALY